MPISNKERTTVKGKLFLGIAAAAVLTASSVFTAGAAEFAKSNTYTSGMFADVSESEWYASSIASSYELGFMKGTAETMFEPNGNMTVAEAITIAARVHDAYNAKGTQFGTGSANWYDDYVAYAVTNGIIEEGQFDDYNRPVKRWEMAVIFSKSVPESFLEARNSIDEIPDVPETNSYYDSLALLYNAGVVMGNDEFGTFMPNNNIIRAEAAAIINRVALPESRLQKTLVDANYDDAYYLINDGSCRFASNNLGYSITSPWTLDNRSSTGSSSGPNGLSDFNPNGKVEVWRDIDDVTEGLIGFEFIANIQFGEDGTYFRITDDDKNSLMSLDTVDGKFFFQGTDTGVEVSNGKYYVKMKADLDNNTAVLYINGNKIGTGFTVGDVTASRVYIGSDEEGLLYLSVDRCDVYKDYLVNELFLDPAGSALSAWEVTGTGEVVYTGGQGYNDVNSAKMTAGSVAKQSFNPISGSVIFETYMLFPEDADTGYVSLNSGDTSVAKLVINNDGVFTADGTKLRHHTNNIWQCLRIEADTVNGTVTYKVNGKIVDEKALDAYAPTVDNITIGVTGGTAYFDDVTVSLTHEYDDYCPEPVPITDDGYDVILNVCSLWHEGSHSGWGCETAYPDIEPALGYYDEGLAEVADWEIKFMVENGIDVQHLCWYCPSGNIKEPIKRSNLNWALHDGYFNAEYSDMMKFTFMWENNGVNVSNLEQFKEYIWSYWVDYYFLDDRFYTIDNKIVFTVWNYNNFQKAFGGTNSGCIEAVEFMNEDIKKYGFDGVMIFFADSHRTDAASFEAMAAMGGTAAYAYHWQQDGVYAENTINRLQKNQDYGKLHIVPTVSVGFNNIGWSGVRKPMASLEEHRKVLEYIKNDYLTEETGWKANTLIVSTWNEFGEGTYVMPSEGLHGFGYLENIAEVISGVTDHSSNIYPTEQQKARLGHLYPDSKTSLERLDIEQPSSDTPEAVLYTATGADMEPAMRIAESRVEGDVIIATTTENDSAITIKKDKLFEPTETEDIIAIRLSIKSNVDAYTELFFTTDKLPSVAQEQSFGFNIQKSDDFKEYVISTAGCETWSGKVQSFRLDILNKPGTFEVAKFEFLGYSDAQLPITISANSRLYEPVFAPEERGGELYVTAEPEAGFFQIHNFYYEWSRYTGKLLIATADNHEIVFTVGSDTAIVDGTEAKLKEAVTLKDGIPVLPLYFLYDSLGITYTMEDKLLKAVIYMSEFDEEYNEIINSRVPFEYEFEITGDAEGFGYANTSMIIMNGTLQGTAIKKSDGSYDPIVSQSNVEIDASKYNQVVVSMKYDVEKEGSHIELFFTTDTNTTADQAKSLRFPLEGTSSNGEFVEYVFDCTQNTYWNGTVTSVRIDPISGNGSFEIDYIRIQENKELAEQKAKEEADRLARGFEIINGDAEDTDNIAFFNSTKDSTIEIVKDETTDSNVYKVTAKAAYSYARQSAVYEPGKKYTVTVDVKLIGTVSGNTDIKTKFHCNARYTDSAGTVDHVVFGEEMSPSDGWKTLTFSFEVPADVTPLATDEFTFYTNPANNEGVSYMFDNVSVVVE